MKIFQNLLRNTKEAVFQSKNEAVFSCMREHGFSLADIRRALMILNGIQLADLMNGRVSKPTVANTIVGRRRNSIVMASLAGRLGLDVERLFPEV